MKRLLIYFLVALLYVPSSLMAQDADVDGGSTDDVKTDLTLSVEKKLSKKFNLGVEAEWRTRDNVKATDRFSLSPSLDYKIIRHLKLAVGGAFMYYDNAAKDKYRSSDGTLKWHRDSYWAPRYRGFIGLTGDIDAGRFNFSLRERYQLTYRSNYTATRHYYTKDGEYNYDEDDARESETNQVLRSRLQVCYDIRHCSVDPYVCVEMTNDLVDNFSVDKMRYVVGAEWKINKHHGMEFYYMYQNVDGDDGEDDENSHIIGISYKYKF